MKPFPSTIIQFSRVPRMTPVHNIASNSWNTGGSSIFFRAGNRVFPQISRSATTKNHPVSFLFPTVIHNVLRSLPRVLLNSRIKISISSQCCSNACSANTRAKQRIQNSIRSTHLRRHDSFDHQHNCKQQKCGSATTATDEEK